MSRTVTLLELRTQVRQRCDMVGSNFVSDDELTGYINASISELYDLLLLNFGEDYYTNPTPLSLAIVAGTDSYSLESSTYKIAGIDIQVGGLWVSLKRYTMGARNRAQEASTLKDARYRLIGTKLRFTPSPTAAHTCRVWEVPAPTKLVDDDDTFDGIAGWEEYVIVDSAIKCLAKEESDVRVLAAAKAAQVERVTRASKNRDIGEPDEITDIYDCEIDDYYVVGNW